ncbi:hypothetical protein ACWEGQ_09915 [Streptomyces seoulensis]
MVTTPADLSAFMIKLPPTDHVRVAEFAHGGPDLDENRLGGVRTHYESVTGRRPLITLHQARLGETAFGDEDLNGVWCGRPPLFAAAEDAHGALGVFHRALMGHGLLYVDPAHPHWRVLGAPDDVLDALGATGFSFVRVRPEPDHPGVLAVKKLRCCEDGSPLYDRQAVLRSTP